MANKRIIVPSIPGMKQDEIDLFRSFCEALPAGGYLTSILQGMPNRVEHMIRSDFAYSLAEATRQPDQELLAVREQVQEAKAELAEAVLQKKYAENHLKYVKGNVEKIVEGTDDITAAINNMRHFAASVKKIGEQR